MKSGSAGNFKPSSTSKQAWLYAFYKNEHCNSITIKDAFNENVALNMQAAFNSCYNVKSVSLINCFNGTAATTLRYTFSYTSSTSVAYPATYTLKDVCKNAKGGGDSTAEEMFSFNGAIREFTATSCFTNMTCPKFLFTCQNLSKVTLTNFGTGDYATIIANGGAGSFKQFLENSGNTTASNVPTDTDAVYTFDNFATGGPDVSSFMNNTLHSNRFRSAAVYWKNSHSNTYSHVLRMLCEYHRCPRDADAEYQDQHHT